MNKESEPTVWASIGTTVNTGNFENIKIDVGLSGIPVGSTDEYLAHKLQEANLTLEKVVSILAQQLGDRIDEYGRKLWKESK